MAFNTFYKNKDIIEKYKKTAELERSSGKLVPNKLKTYGETELLEYSELAKQVGVTPPNLAIEEFKIFLNKKDIPVFNLQEVISYMDKKADRESKEQSGWEWRPLRDQDHIKSVMFGTKARREWIGAKGTYDNTPASDYYQGPIDTQRWVSHQSSSANNLPSITTQAAGVYSPSLNEAIQQQSSLQQYQQAMLAQQSSGHYIESTTLSPNKVYDYTVPAHALKKVALIAKHYGNKVSLFVSDYALAPVIEYPDPFLMAVINNSHLHNGTGRFIIDFWDEPGFGLESQLK